jgi:hypothetical protein
MRLEGMFLFQDLILLWKSYPTNYRSGMQQFPDYARERVVPCRRKFLFFAHALPLLPAAA